MRSGGARARAAAARGLPVAETEAQEAEQVRLAIRRSLLEELSAGQPPPAPPARAAASTRLAEECDEPEAEETTSESEFSVVVPVVPCKPRIVDCWTVASASEVTTRPRRGLPRHTAYYVVWRIPFVGGGQPWYEGIHLGCKGFWHELRHLPPFDR